MIQLTPIPTLSSSKKINKILKINPISLEQKKSQSNNSDGKGEDQNEKVQHIDEIV